MGQLRELQQQFTVFLGEIGEFLDKLPPDIARPLRGVLSTLGSFEDLNSRGSAIVESFGQALTLLDEAEFRSTGSRPTNGESWLSRSGQALKDVAKEPWTRALLLYGLAGLAMTAAWYTHTILPLRLIATDRTPDVVVHERKVAISWGLAAIEYPFVILAGKVAEKAGIELSRIRAPVELMNLAWFVAFLKLVKKEPTDWRHYCGLAASAVGTMSMGIPDSALAFLRRPQRATQQGQPTSLSPSQVLRKKERAQNLEMNGEKLIAQVLEIERSLQALLGGDIELGASDVQVSEEIRLAADSMETSSTMLQQLHGLATEIEGAVRQSQQGLESALASTTHWSRHAEKYLYLGVAAVLMAGSLVGAFQIRNNRAKAALFGVVAAGIKSLAWYGHHAIPQSSKPSSSIASTRPRLKSVVSALEDIATGYSIAHLEYQALVRANSLSNLAEVRSGLIAADLLYSVGFMKVVMGEKISAKTGLALVMAGVGVALANLPLTGSPKSDAAH